MYKRQAVFCAGYGDAAAAAGHHHLPGVSEGANGLQLHDGLGPGGGHYLAVALYLDQKDAFMYRLVPVLIEVMGKHYPESVSYTHLKRATKIPHTKIAV